MSERAERIERFLAAAGWSDAARTPLPGDASFRRYVRLARPGGTAMLMDAPPPQEDVRPFVRIARHLQALGLAAPGVLAVDADAGLLVIEDLGDGTFTRLLAAGADEAALYDLAVDALLALHGHPRARDVAVPPYDEDRFLAEAHLLTDWTLPVLRGTPLPAAAREGYAAAWSAARAATPRLPPTLVLRDFHVDNLMRLDDRKGVAACGLIDFQDALAGPPTYDFVSLVQDARRDLSPGLPERLRARYLAGMPDLDPAAFDASAALWAAQRHAKVIGIFTRLARRDGKPAYLAHIPRVWRLLEAALAAPALAPVAEWLAREVPAGDRRVPGS